MTNLESTSRNSLHPCINISNWLPKLEKILSNIKFGHLGVLFVSGWRRQRYECEG